MVFQLDFKGPYHISKSKFEYHLYGLYLHSGHFSVQKGEAFLSYFGLKNLLFTFSERDFSALKLLNH